MRNTKAAVRPYSEHKGPRIRVYVTARSGVHHTQMAAAARRALRGVECPDYVSTVTGESRPGKWSDVLTVPGTAGPLGHGVHTQQREYDAIILPA